MCCWWKKSCTAGWWVVYPTTYWGSTHPRWLAGFLPSTVSLVKIHPLLGGYFKPKQFTACRWTILIFRESCTSRAGPAAPETSKLKPSWGFFSPKNPIAGPWKDAIITGIKRIHLTKQPIFQGLRENLADVFDRFILLYFFSDCNLLREVFGRIPPRFRQRHNRKLPRDSDRAHFARLGYWKADHPWTDFCG